jgi:hypothetical protein
MSLLPTFGRIKYISSSRKFRIDERIKSRQIAVPIVSASVLAFIKLALLNQFKIKRLACFWKIGTEFVVTWEFTATTFSSDCKDRRGTMAASFTDV